MTREEIVDRLNRKNFTTNEAISLILEFAESNKHSKLEIDKLSQLLASNSVFISWALPNMVKYVIQQYHINTIMDKQGRLICYF